MNVSKRSEVRFGVLGTGWVAQRFMADLQSVRGAKLVAVASRSDARARALSARFGAARGHGSYEALIADENVDVVYIASEHHEHAPHALACFAAGKHVLCEKPFTTSLAETERVIAAARAAARFCMEGLWTRFLPAVVEAKRRIEGGAIGTPLHLSADFGMPVVNAGDNRFFDPARGGGALLDRGVYAVSFAVGLFGNPVEVQASAVMSPSGVDETACAILKFTDGRMATLACSLSAYSSNEVVVAGSSGRLRLHAPLVRPEKLSVDRAHVLVAGEAKSDLDPRSVRERGRRLVARAKPYLPAAVGRSSGHRYAVDGYGYGYEAAEVVRCVREKLLESPALPLSETRSVAAVVERIAACFKLDARAPATG
jgi:predicted dehydrogenase